MVAIGWDRWLPAPAKLNLFLHVTGRRSDGYHALQTVFRLIDRADQLSFLPRTDGAIALETPLAGVGEEENLAVRAAAALRARSGGSPGVTIRLRKTIPIVGGLGGGSSDAATTLLALNRLWGLDLPGADLAEIGVGLGADVPVFLVGRNAFAEGIGEQLTAVQLPPAWYLVLMPQVSISTREIFADPTLTRNTPAIKIAAFFAGQQTANDLEPVVRRRFPAVGHHLDWLSRFARARLTGSGGCVFAEFSSENEARSVLKQLPGTLRGFVARGLDQHPLESGQG
jgi:4-diphosphocytidyl-2-C-methyl-D-erythritol kinase